MENDKEFQVTIAYQNNKYEDVKFSDTLNLDISASTPVENLVEEKKEISDQQVSRQSKRINKQQVVDIKAEAEKEAVRVQAQKDAEEKRIQEEKALKAALEEEEE